MALLQPTLCTLLLLMVFSNSDAQYVCVLTVFAQRHMKQEQGTKTNCLFSVGSCIYEWVCICIWTRECVSEYLAKGKYVFGSGQYCVPALGWLRSLGKGLAGGTLGGRSKWKKMEMREVFKGIKGVSGMMRMRMGEERMWRTSERIIVRAEDDVRREIWPSSVGPCILSEQHWPSADHRETEGWMGRKHKRQQMKNFFGRLAGCQAPASDSPTSRDSPALCPVGRNEFEL